MTYRLPPRRSVLFMPANNARAIHKARQLPVDAVILDLEDAVGPAAKPQARAAACQALAEGGFGHREILVRINRLDTPWGIDDLSALATGGVAGIVLPKVDHADEAAACLDHLRTLGCQAPLWAMIESPAGVHHVEAIAAVPGVGALVMGTNDLLKALGGRDTADRQALQYALSRTILAARLHDRSVLDGVSSSLHDGPDLRAACAQGAILGFDGKTLIHPNQIAAANEAFSQSPDAIEAAQRIVAAWQKTGSDPGVIQVDGQMIEALHVAQAEQLLAYAAELARR